MGCMELGPEGRREGTERGKVVEIWKVKTVLQGLSMAFSFSGLA